MANQVSNKAVQRQQNVAKQERIRRYNAEKADALKIFAIIFGATLLIAIITLIVTLCADVVYVHLDGYGKEVVVSGTAFLKALFSGNYSSADYDNLAMPFYYYAKAWCQPAAVFTLLTVIMTVLTILVAAGALVYSILKKDYTFSWFSLIATSLAFIVTVVTFAIALSMKNGTILSQYCGGNPKCTIESDLIWCVILSLLTVAANIFAVIKFVRIEKVRKGKA